MKNKKSGSSQKQTMQTIAGVVCAGVIAVCATAQTPSAQDSGRAVKTNGLPINIGASQVTVKTITGEGVNHGITYTINVNGALPLASTNIVVMEGKNAHSFVLLSVDAPSLSTTPVTIDFDLDQDTPSTISTPLQFAASTSFGFRGQGEMPTALHPRTELTFKDKKGDYGSALLIKNVQVLAFVSQPMFIKDDKARTSVVVASDFQSEKTPDQAGSFFDETRFKASNVAIWRLDREFLASIVNDTKAQTNHIQTAKLLLERIEKQ